MRLSATDLIVKIAMADGTAPGGRQEWKPVPCAMLLLLNAHRV